MSDTHAPLVTTQQIEAARQAVTELRDAARLGRVIEFRQRDPLVWVLHRVIDFAEAALAPPSVASMPLPADERRVLHEIIADCNALIDPEANEELSVRIDAVLQPCSEANDGKCHPPSVASPIASEDYKALYFELLYQVVRKHPSESRHQTALRYIKQAEEATSVNAGATPSAEGATESAHPSSSDLLVSAPPFSELVTCSLKDPDWVAHPRRLDCEHEMLYLIAACGAFVSAPPPRDRTEDHPPIYADEHGDWAAANRGYEQRIRKWVSEGVHLQAHHVAFILAKLDAALADLLLLHQERETLKNENKRLLARIEELDVQPSPQHASTTEKA